MSRHYDHDGDPVTAEDVLDAEELADYYRQRRNHGHTFNGHTPRTICDELGYVSLDGGNTWTWEP